MTYRGLELEEDDSEPKTTTKTFHPFLPCTTDMADESLRQIPLVLVRLTVDQATTTWSRHMKMPGSSFKPDT